MLDLRSPVILGAAPAGIALAALAWLAFDSGRAVTKPLDSLQARVVAATPPSPRDGGAGDPAAIVLAAPLFPLTTGPGAVPEPALRLDGVAISPRGQSALLAIGGKPAHWLDRGATEEGITLIEVHAGGILVDTEVGFEDVALGATTSAGGGGQASSSANSATASPPS